MTFDVDMNGILHVSAVEKSTGQTNKITVANDKNRLSKDDIDRMVRDAEQFREEDERQQSRIAAKNSLESFCFHAKATAEQEGKIQAADRAAIQAKCSEILDWLDANPLADQTEYELKYKELESLCHPIFAKQYQDGHPVVDEVD